jgi:threonine synthase
LLLGAYLGFKELKEAGLIQTVPRLIGVQAVSCAPLYQAFERGTEEVPPLGDTETLAEGIAISNPVRGRQILQALRETGGLVLAVREEEIGDALKEMGRNGFFIEPTSAATMAGLKQYLLHKTPKETVVASLTGTGLKSVGKMV